MSRVVAVIPASFEFICPNCYDMVRIINLKKIAYCTGCGEPVELNPMIETLGEDVTKALMKVTGVKIQNLSIQKNMKEETND